MSVGGARKKFMEFNVNKDGQLTHDEMYRAWFLFLPRNTSIPSARYSGLSLLVFHSCHR